MVVIPAEHGIYSHTLVMQYIGPNRLLKRLGYSSKVSIGVTSRMNASQSRGLWGSQLKSEIKMKSGLINTEPVRHVVMLAMSALSHRRLRLR